MNLLVLSNDIKEIHPKGHMILFKLLHLLENASNLELFQLVIRSK